MGTFYNYLRECSMVMYSVFVRVSNKKKTKFRAASFSAAHPLINVFVLIKVK